MRCSSCCFPSRTRLARDASGPPGPVPVLHVSLPAPASFTRTVLGQRPAIIVAGDIVLQRHVNIKRGPELQVEGAIAKGDLPR